MRKIVTVILLLFIYGAAARAQKVDCRGTVTDAAGRALEGVTIRLEPDRHFIQTNSKGVFLLKQVYTGSYMLYAGNVGYKTHQQSITLENGVSPVLKGVSHIFAPSTAFRSVGHRPVVSSTGGCPTRLRKYGMHLF